MPPYIGFSSVKTGITCPHVHLYIASEPSSPVSLLPAGSCFYRFRLDPHAFPPLWFLFDAVFIVFPCPSLIVFSSFSIPFGAALSRFLGFPFVSLTVVACRGAVRYCFPPVPVSSPVSVFELSGGAVLPVPWAGGLFRGVALRGWRGVLPLFVWRLVSTVCGAGRFGWFFHVEIIGGLFVGRGGFVASGGKRTPRGLSVPSERSSWFGLFYMWGAVALIPLASCDGVGGEGGGGE